MDHRHLNFSGPYEIRGRHRGSRGSRYSNRGGGGRNESSKNRFVETSSDGESLVYTSLGTDNFGDPSICDSVRASLKLIGEYSEDSEKKFVNDRSYLSFILTKYLPHSFKKHKIVDIDLNIADNEIEVYSGSGKQDLSNFLTWIVNNMETFSREINNQNISSEGGRFVTTKKVLSNFVAIPYRYLIGLKFYDASINGVTYMRKEYEPDNGQIGKWAHKFEQIVTRDDTSKGVICNEDFRTVISSNLGPHKLLYSASLDCANPEEFEDDFTDLSSFINLKCCEESDPIRFRHLMLHWYLNYILSGVPKVLLGVRDVNGVVKRLQLFEATEMLEMGKELWNPVNCLVFTSKLLSFIKNRVESEPGVVFCVEKKSKEAKITCSKVNEFENFLPDWFLAEINLKKKEHT